MLVQQDGSEVRFQSLFGKTVQFTAKSKLILSLSSFEEERNLKLAIDSYDHYLNASNISDNNDTFLVLASTSGEVVDKAYLKEL